MIGFVTGSDGNATLAEGLGDLTDVHSGIVFKGGMARIAMSPPPELTAPIDEVQDWSDACGLLGFVMYALDREDWMSEFIEYENMVRDSIMTAVDKAHLQEVRSKFTVIEGGKQDIEDGKDEGS